MPQLLDEPEKYMLERPLRESRDLRRMRQTPRGPNMRTLVKLAMECDSAEQLGNRLRRRFENKAKRSAATEAELDQWLGPTG